MPTDRPGSPSRPEGYSLADLRQRLDQMSPAHPSSPRYRGGQLSLVPRRDHERLRGETSPESASRRDARPPSDRRAGASPERADRWQPAANRPEWQEPLARGEVDRIGLGVVDERDRRFLPAEHRIAIWLADRGAAVVALPEDPAIRQRKPDARVDDRVTEFKSLQQGATDSTVVNQLHSARGQAPHVVIDTRGSGIDEMTAEHGVARFIGSPWGGDGFDSILILGEDFLISKVREGGDDERR